MSVQLKPDTMQQVNGLLPFPMEGRDLDFVVDWLVWVGCRTVQVSMENHPGMSMGHLMSLTLEQKEGVH
ncbi:MAG: hypothetical protein EPN21_06550 [Methylococcaceae bacterium]|nr:MAG: hypothetical protein EPN21_06550 [Methylococcaceae bacterium]